MGVDGLPIAFMEPQSRLFRLASIADQSRQQVYGEIQHASVTCMFDLGNVFQLVVHRFNQGTLSQQDFVHQRHEAVFHVPTQGCNELNAMLPQRMEQTGRNVTLVAEELSGQSASQGWDRLSVVNISRRQRYRQQFAAFVDDQMEFETEKPAHRCFTQLGKPVEYAVSPDSLVAADRQCSRVDERDAGVFAITCLQICG